MLELFIGLTCVLVAICAVLGWTVLRRNAGSNGDAQSVRDELRLGRQESSEAARRLREEVTSEQKDGTETIARPWAKWANSNRVNSKPSR